MKKTLIILALIAISYTAIFRTEIDNGICINQEQDGAIYNCDPNYNYISYRRTTAEPGDKIISLFILNPMNTAPDDYIYRADWIYRRASR